MEQNRAANAAHRINGYFSPHACEATMPAFERAKAQAVEFMKRDVADIEAMTIEQFMPRCETPGHRKLTTPPSTPAFDIQLVSTEHHSLQTDEIPIRAENRAGEVIFMILKRDQIEEALIAHNRTTPRQSTAGRSEAFTLDGQAWHAIVDGEIIKAEFESKGAAEAAIPVERARRNRKRAIAETPAEPIRKTFLSRFDEHDCGGVFDGHGVISDADPGL